MSDRQGLSQQEVKASGGSTIRNVIQMVVNLDLALLAKQLWVFISRHWPLLLSLIIVDGGLVALFLNYQDRFLWQRPVLMLAEVLATVAIWTSYLIYRRRNRGRAVARLLWPLAAVSAILFLLLIFWQGVATARPTQFRPEQFGIAVARFGQGSEFRGSQLTRDITDQVIRGLNETVSNRPEWKSIAVMPVGLVSDRDGALAAGNRVNADLVVWGQVIPIGEGAIAVSFEVIETPDWVGSPVLPMILPVDPRFSQRRLNVDLDPEALDRLISQQSEVITAFSLGLAAYFNRDLATAVNRLQVAANRASTAENSAEEDNRLGLIYYYLGRSYQRLGEFRQGESILQEASSYMPYDPAVSLSLAYGHNSLGQEGATQVLAQETIDKATAWLQLHPDNVQAAYDRGLAYILLDRPLLAATEFDAIIRERNESFYAAYLSAGQAYLEAGKTQTAIDRLQGAVNLAQKEHVDPSWGYLFLGNAYTKVGDDTRAATYYQQAVTAAPHIDWMHYAYARFLERVGEYEQAETEYRLVIEKTYDKVWGYALLAAHLRRQDRLQEAIEAYGVVRRERPDDVISQFSLAELYMETDQTAQAVQIYEEALRRRPDSVYGHISYGNALAQLAEYEEAISHFQQALLLNPEECTARHNLAQMYETDGRTAEALAEYQHVAAAPGEFCSESLKEAARERVADIRGATPTSTMATVEGTITATRSLITPTPTNTPQPLATLAAPSTPSPTAIILADPPTPTTTYSPPPSPSPIATDTLTPAAKPETVATLPPPPTPTETDTPQPTPTLTPPPTPTETDTPQPTATLPPPATPTETDTPQPTATLPPPPTPTETDTPQPTVTLPPPSTSAGAP